MKKRLSILMTILSISIMSFAQDSIFELNKDSLTDYVVTPIENYSQAELYNKTLLWVMETYKNPDEVISAKVENDFIRIGGSSQNLFCINGLGAKTCYVTRYDIDISFKEGKYKFDVTSLEYLVGARWQKFPLNDTKGLYNKKGELRVAYVHLPEIPTYFNDLNSSLKSFILNDSLNNKDGW